MWNLEKIDKFAKLHNWYGTYDTNLQQQIYKNYRTDQQQIDDNVTEIARWCHSVPEIPDEGQDKQFIEMMLKRNKFQLERTKLKIQHYFVTIPKFGEIFSNLGHNRLCNEVVFSLPLPELNQHSERIVIFKINRNIGGTIDIKQALLTLTTVATLGFHYDQALRLRFILDFNGFEFMQFLKLRPNVIFIVLEILERILSVSIAGIEIINSPFYLNLILALFKMTMKPKLLSRITVHKSLDSLYQTIPAQYLPVGYGSNPAIIEDLFDEMPPNTVNATTGEDLQNDEIQATQQQQQQHSKIEDYTKYKNTIHTLWGYFDQPLRWGIIVHILIYHTLAVIALFTFPYLEKKRTLLWNYVLGVATIFGITAGVHRLWTHKSYKATMPLRIILAICYTLSGHYSMYHWVRDHRVHHKYSDTEADPFNVSRGFFYAQIGFLFLKKHPAVLKKAAGIDSRDLLQDPVMAFFKTHYWPMQIIFHFLIPMGVPVYFWNESLYWSIMISSIRFVACLHITTAVNSVAHQYGTKPYDKRHKSVENMVYSIFALGEGWHNYHHAFPWDYKAEEFGRYTTNFTTFMLDLFGKLGWAYDFKTASPDLVKKFTMKHGDGTHPYYSGMEFKESENFEYDSARWE